MLLAYITQQHCFTNIWRDHRSDGSLLVQVLHMDRNNYYGGESASLNLNQVRPGAAVYAWQLLGTCAGRCPQLHPSA